MNKSSAFTAMSELETVLLKQRGLTYLLSRCIQADTPLQMPAPMPLEVEGIHALSDAVSHEVSGIFVAAFEAATAGLPTHTKGGEAAA